MYYNGKGVDQNYEKAAAWFKKAAEHGEHVKAQFHLGQMYYWGEGVRQNYKKDFGCGRAGKARRSSKDSR